MENRQREVDAVPQQTPQLLGRQIRKARTRNNRIQLMLELLATVLVVYLVFGLVFGTAVIDGVSMYPNYKNGDVALLWRLGNGYRYGDVVLFRTVQGEEYVKRVIGVAGDTVDIDASGTVIINGAAKKDDYIYYETYPREGCMTFPVTVPANTVFVLGDYRTVSEDSRELGMIPIGSIDGKVIASLRLHS